MRRRWEYRANTSIVSGAFSLGLWACGGSAASEPDIASIHDELTAAPPSEAPSGGAACAELLASLQGKLLAQVSQRAAEVRVSPFANAFVSSAVSSGEVPSLGTAPAVPAPRGQHPAATDVWGATRQVPGVEESDFVKTEGERLYVVSGATLYVVDAGDARATEVVGSIPIEGELGEIFVHDGKAAVFSRYYGAPAGIENFDIPNFYSTSFTKVTVLDVTSAAPEVLREAYVEGDFAYGRRQEGVVRTVVSQRFREPIDYPSISYADAFGRPRSQAQIDLQVDLWVRLATDSIAASTVEHYLPATFERIGGELVQRPQRCEDYRLPPAGLNQLDSTRIVSLDLDSDGPLEAVSVLGFPDSIYLDDEALLVRQTDYSSTTATDPAVYTDIHRFDLDGVHVTHAASGRLRGYIQGRFELDQSHGVVRALTLEDVYAPTPGGSDGDITNVGKVSHIVTLGAAGGVLTELTPLVLSPDQSIFGVRFVDDHAYVTTGISSDGPNLLSVVDLTNAEAPQLLASISLPGSAFALLPLPGERLLGIGRAPDATGSSTSLAFLLIETSDPAAPSVTARYVYAEPTSTEAAFDTKLISFDPARSRFVLPVQNAASSVSSLDVFQITEAGFTRLGGIVPPPPDPTLLECMELFGYSTDPESVAAFEQDAAAVERLLAQCRANQQPYVRRGLLGGDTVYLITNTTLGTYDIGAFGAPPLSEVALPATWPY